MNQTASQQWRFRFAVVTALATLVLVGIGGLVTSHGVGMAVPDWPTSYGYNMFALPISTWLTGGIFHEHTHRIWATVVGTMVVALTRWLGGSKSCRPLMLIGAAEIIAGLALLKLGPDWKGAGHFLAGIGGVVLLSGLVGFNTALAAMLAKFTQLVSARWGNSAFAEKLAQFTKGVSARLAQVNNAPAARPLPTLGWLAFWLVQFQGLLGGLRVVLDAQAIADVRLGTAFGVFHGCLGQVFLVLLGVIALLTSPWWQDFANEKGATKPAASSALHRWFAIATLLIFGQLLIAATMRHQHAGLAIPDFPLAYGAVWPDMSTEAVASYNLQRVEVTESHPITAFQIGLQMTHRIVAVLILVAVVICWGKTRAGTPLRRVGGVWLGLILGQVALGAWTIWSNKAADVATAHVVVGALSLVTGAFGCLISFRRFAGTQFAQVAVSESEAVMVNRVSA